MTFIAICADDYGQNAAIDAAINTLVGMGRLSAVSCFSTAPRWQQHSAPLLREQAGLADIGLHFNLTESFDSITPAPSLSRTILRSYLRQLDPQQIRVLFHQQLDAFEAALGQTPDFIDGHQHVHQLPVVRDVLLTELAARYPAKRPWIRNTVPANQEWRGKPQILSLLGGKALAKMVAENDFPTNNGFAGVYGFKPNAMNAVNAANIADYAARFEAWLQSARTGMLLMCHPGADARDVSDAIAVQRVVEYGFLKSERFVEILAELGVRVGRVSGLLGS